MDKWASFGSGLKWKRRACDTGWVSSLLRRGPPGQGLGAGDTSGGYQVNYMLLIVRGSSTHSETVQPPHPGLHMHRKLKQVHTHTSTHTHTDLHTLTHTHPHLHTYTPLSHGVISAPVAADADFHNGSHLLSCRQPRGGACPGSWEPQSLPCVLVWLYKSWNQTQSSVVGSHEGPSTVTVVPESVSWAVGAGRPSTGL